MGGISGSDFNHIVHHIGATFFVDELTDSGKGYADGPERGLLSALLFDGIQGYISWCLASKGKERSRFSEAYNWVTNSNDEYVFSFENVCEALGVNPEYLRLGLLNACNSLLTEVGSHRRNF